MQRSALQDTTCPALMSCVDSMAGQLTVPSPGMVLKHKQVGVALQLVNVKV
jgi:hypothetical protein